MSGFFTKKTRKNDAASTLCMTNENTFDCEKSWKIPNGKVIFDAIDPTSVKKLQGHSKNGCWYSTRMDCGHTVNGTRMSFSATIFVTNEEAQDNIFQTLTEQNEPNGFSFSDVRAETSMRDKFGFSITMNGTSTTRVNAIEIC